MKKIISIIAALSLVTTVFASFAHAESDTATSTVGVFTLANFNVLNEAIKVYEDIQAKADDYWGREWTWAEAATAYDAAKAIDQETETDQAKVDTAAKALSDAVGKFVIRPLTTVYASDIDIITKTDNLSGFKSYGITAQFDILPKEEVKRIVYDLRDGDTVSKCTFDVSAFANGEYLVNSIIGLSIIGCPMDSDLIVENVYMDNCACECRNFNSYPVDFETSGILITLDEDTPIKKILGNHATIGIGIEVKPFTEYVFNSNPTYNYIEYTLSNGTKTKEFRWDIGTSINSEATFGLNITNCPLEVNIEVVNVEAKDEPPTFVDSIYDYDSNPSRPDLCYGTQYKNIFDPQLAILDTDILTSKTYNEIFN